MELKRFITLLLPFFWDMTESHIPEAWNPQPHHCENLKTHMCDARIGMLLSPTVSQVNSVHVLPPSTFKLHFNITVYEVAASFKIF